MVILNLKNIKYQAIERGGIGIIDEVKCLFRVLGSNIL
jgi:hypothetical protein